MTNAWLEYDTETGAIKRVSWKEIAGKTVAISRSLAEDFMDGNEKFNAWLVVNDNTSASLTKLTKQDTNSQNLQFANFQDVSTITDNCPIFINNDTVEVLTHAATLGKMLYMTIKNDPSWLIDSWNIKTIIAVKPCKIAVNAASSYSFYIG
jgi:hypothetical protein